MIKKTVAVLLVALFALVAGAAVAFRKKDQEDAPA